MNKLMNKGESSNYNVIKILYYFTSHGFIVTNYMCP